MNDQTKKWVLLGIKAFLTLAFAAAGIAKLMGVQMLVDEFEVIGLGQWFRYATGIIELGSAILLWVPGFAAYAAGLLVCTMVGALIAHATKLGMGTSAGVFVLGPMAALTLYVNRDQLKR
jgi:putative oxidoreductase